MDLPIEQAKRMRAREITVNLCLEPPVYFCPHWTPSLRIRNVPFYTGATQNRFARFHEVATNECVCPLTCILNPAFIGYRRCAANVAPSDLHDSRTKTRSSTSFYAYKTTFSCRVTNNKLLFEFVIIWPVIAVGDTYYTVLSPHRRENRYLYAVYNRKITWVNGCSYRHILSI